MKQLTQKFESPTKGGFSDTRVRLYVFGFMIIGLIMTVKISKFQEYNRESILRHLQAIDKMYNYGDKAEYYEQSLKPYKKKIAVTKVISCQRARQVNHTNILSLALSK